MVVDSSPAILMTGSTGFLGQYVLRELLTRGRRVVAVLRGPLGASSSRLSALLGQIGLNAGPYLERKQLQLVEGSLPEQLPEPHWGATEAFLNCAASLQLFSNGNGDPFKTNVAGTEAVIRWSREHGVKRIHAVSTAYTCGWNAGVIPEAFHQPAPKFQTDYERSKWQAEASLQEWSQESGHVLTVFRPSFLVAIP